MAFDPLTEISALPTGIVLRLGSRGHAVALLRRALALHGLGPYSWRNFNKAVSDRFTDSVLSAVVVFQRCHGLKLDGIVGPLTWRALVGAPQVPLAVDLLEPLRSAADSAVGDGPRRAVAVARAALALHVRETGGQNRGPLVEAIQLYVAGSRHYPWCAAFCDVCLRLGFAAAGQFMLLNVGISCSSLVRRAREVGRVYEVEDHSTGQFRISRPQPGDLMVMRGGDTGYKHLGLVADCQQEDGGIPTIEGNTNDAGSAEGDGVYEKLRYPRCVPSVFVTFCSGPESVGFQQHVAAAPADSAAIQPNPNSSTPSGVEQTTRRLGAGLARLIRPYGE